MAAAAAAAAVAACAWAWHEPATMQSGLGTTSDACLVKLPSSSCRTASLAFSPVLFNLFHICYILATLIVTLFLQALKLSKAGWMLVDVRLASDFDKMSAQGSINVPMFRWASAALQQSFFAEYFFLCNSLLCWG
jgi:hypothetical protein